MSCNNRRVVGLALAMVLTLCMAALAQNKGKGVVDPTKADADFIVQGEYSGQITSAAGTAKLGVQVVAQGGGKFRVVFYPGGLPGDGWGKAKKEEAEGQTSKGITSFSSASYKAQVVGSILTVADKDGKELGKLEKIIRKSPTLGAAAPQGAIVLFDGKNADQWEKGRMTEDGLLMQGATSKLKFQSCTLHVEFMISYSPQGRGQDRGNSGCYMQSRYETQILDSFGLSNKNNECGGIYEVSDSTMQMCFPPLSWQTYDIEFTAAKYDGPKKVKNATITVKFNGVVVQQDVEVPHSTRAAPGQEGPEAAGIHLQDHGHAVRFKNIWVVEKN